MASKAVDAIAVDAIEPSLTLSDIIHTISPSPSPQDDTGFQRAETASPERLTEADISQIRRRVTDMGISSSSNGKVNASLREKELVQMVHAKSHCVVMNILTCSLRS
jgi:hypothetical protein